MGLRNTTYMVLAPLSNSVYMVLTLCLAFSDKDIVFDLVDGVALRTMHVHMEVLGIV